MDKEHLAANVLKVMEQLDETISNADVTIQEGELALLALLAQSAATLAFQGRSQGAQVTNFQVLAPYVKALHSLYTYHYMKLEGRIN